MRIDFRVFSSDPIQRLWMTCPISVNENRYPGLVADIRRIGSTVNVTDLLVSMMISLVLSFPVYDIIGVYAFTLIVIMILRIEGYF